MVLSPVRLPSAAASQVGYGLCSLCWVLTCTLTAAAQSVELDCPAFVECHNVDDPLGRIDLTIEHLVQVDIEIAVESRREHDGELATLLVQVLPLGSSYLLHDFSPRNIQASQIDGPIQIETVREKSGSLGWNTRLPLPPAEGELQAGLAGKRAETIRYQQRPAAELLVASGFFARHSGAYFKFHRSPQLDLEGTHGVSLILRVPNTWRTGLLQVQTSVVRESKQLWGEPATQVAAQRTFLIPIFMVGDHEARNLATAYRSAEERFQQSAATAVRRQQAADRGNPFRGLWGAEPSPALSPDQVDTLLTTSDPNVADQRLLPREVSIAWKEFQRRKQQFVRLAAAHEQPVATR